MLGLDWSIYILVWIVCGIAAFLIAQNRGATNAPVWFLVGVLLGPIGILLAAVGAKGSGQAAAVVGAADELGKLAELRDRGVLTPQEFERQKAALLARSPEPTTTAMTGTAKYVFWGIVAFLVIVIIWLVLNI